MKNKNLNRRNFIKNTGLITASASMHPLFGLFEKALAAPANTSGYKAIVCICLTGGNDGLNWFAPITNNNSANGSNYINYQSARGSVALSQNSFLPLTTAAASDGNNYGIHPSCPELRNLFNSGKMAVLNNIGTLIRPVSVTQARANPMLLPPSLFAHNEQRDMWMTSIANTLNKTGWAGKVADILSTQGSNPLSPLNISLAGNNIFQSGLQTSGYSLNTNGPQALEIGGRGSLGNLNSTFQNLLSMGRSSSNLMVQTLSQVHQRSADLVPLFKSALDSAGNFSTVFPQANNNGINSGLERQFISVAKLIKSRSIIGGSRQIFFIEANGFDTHGGQLGPHAEHLGIISKLMNAFHNAMVEIGQQDNVVQFTLSDFGRTLASNSGGTDHGWGSHSIVVGGGVQGGKFYGNAPSLIVNGVNDLGNGRLLPTTSTDQHVATLMRWFGIAESDINLTLPNLANFSAQRNHNFISGVNMGYMG